MRIILPNRDFLSHEGPRVTFTARHRILTVTFAILGISIFTSVTIDADLLSMMMPGLPNFPFQSFLLSKSIISAPLCHFAQNVSALLAVALSSRDQWPLILGSVPSLLTLKQVLERKDPDLVLAENGHFIEQLTNTIPDIITVYDITENRLIYLNRRASTVLGYSKSDLQKMGETMLERMVHPDDFAQYPNWMAEWMDLEDGEVFQHECRIRHKDGDWRWFNSRDVVFKRDTLGRPTQIMTVAHDVTDRKVVEEALLESQLRNMSILRALPDLMFVQHEDGTYLDFYASKMDELVAPPEVFLGRNMREILPPEILGEVAACFERAKYSGKTETAEYTLEVDDKKRVYECRIVRSGREKILSIVREVTEQRVTATALAESEARFGAQYRGIPIPTYTWQRKDEDFELIDYNDDAICANNGTIVDMLGSSASELFKYSPEVLETFRHCFQEKITIEQEYFGWFLPVGDRKHFDITYVPVPPDMVMVHVQDATARKFASEDMQAKIEELQAAEEEIAEQNRQLRRAREQIEAEKHRYWELFEFAPCGYLTTDQNGVIIEANQTASVLFNERRTMLVGCLITALASKKARKSFRSVLEALLGKETSREFEAALLRDGEEFQAIVKVERDETDGSTYYRWLIQDISDRKNAELALQNNERFSRSIIESSGDCIKILDLAGNLLFLNKKGKELLEMEDDSCLDHPWLQFWDEASRTALEPEVETAKAGGIGRYQGECPTARGTVKWWDVQISPITDAHGNVERLLVISRDITAQKLADERLLRKESFFRSLTENAQDLVTVLRLDGTIVYESPACERILGFRPEERIGHNCLDYIHPEDRPAIEEIFATTASNGGSAGAVQYRYTHKSGDYVYLEVIGRLSTDEDGEPIIIANKRDISERKRREEQYRQLAARLLNLQDEERRRLARELHDDTAQNLALLNINLASIKHLLHPDQEKSLAILNQSSTLLQQCLKDVRTMSYVLHPPSLDDRGLVSALQWLLYGFSERSEIDIDFDHDDDLGRLPSDIELALYRVVQEALSNIHRHSGSNAAHVSLKRAANQIEIVIKDEGHGIPKHIVDAAGGFHSSGVGIPGMRERLRLLGGNLDIHSTSAGVTVKARVPL
jgi:PAS domain S-box-containing protein